MNYPANYKYTKDHEWINLADDIATVGITAHAAEQMGDVVFVELPETGTNYEINDVFGVVESVKAAVDCYMPVSGEIYEVNEELESAYEMMNEDPHVSGWIVKIKISDPTEMDKLMTAEAYTAYLSTLV
ncbi:glycine cleavage system protein GcvH [bacterium]|nr:glycine cleavage system protein GcvH [bacterium]